jgi:type I restriction enzyme, S subunit
MKQGWKIERLDDACDVEYGTRVVNKRDGGTLYPVYGGGGATFSIDTFNRENCFVVARFAMSEQCTRFVEGKFFLNDSGLSVRPKNSKEILQDFLNLQMLYLNDHIYSLARGTAQKNLDVPAFRNIEITFPKSLQNQQQIVSVLNEAFAAIAKAKSNAEQNLKNAKELFESYLQGVFENKLHGSKFETLDSLCELIVDCEHKTAPTQETGYPSIRTPNIGKGVLILEGVNRVSEKTYKNGQDVQFRKQMI